MISRFNYTDRIDLKAKMFEIVVKDGPPRSFEANWDIAGLSQPIPADTKVYLEAMASGSPTVLRFAFGTVADRKIPVLANLNELAGENIHFTVKLVDETQEIGRLVGLCENIRPKSQGEEGGCGKQPILPVAPIDLGQQIWRIAYESNRTYLQVNKNIPDIMDIVKNDPRFFALVFPEVIRQILYRALIIERHDEVTNEDDNWKDQWLRYAITWHPDKEPPPSDLSEPLDDDGREQLEQWIDDAIRGFCAKKGPAHLFITAEEGED